MSIVHGHNMNLSSNGCDSVEETADELKELNNDGWEELGIMMNLMLKFYYNFSDCLLDVCASRFTCFSILAVTNRHHNTQLPVRNLAN